MKRLMLLFAFPALFVTGCKKEDACNLSSTSILGTFKVVSYTLQETATSTPVDFYPLFDACDKDNTYTFYENGTFVVADAGIVCDEYYADSESWELIGNTIIFGNDEIGVAEIENFSCTRFVIKVEEGLEGGIMKITFQRV